jgi:signal transduction histidine kinase
MFLVFVSVPSLFISVLTFTNYKNSLETNRLSDLQNIAAFKADRIETFFAGLKANIEVAQGYYNVKKNLPILNRLAHDPDDAEYRAARQTLDKQLQHMQPLLHLSDIMLVNPQGEVVYSSNLRHMKTDFLHLLPDPQQKAFEKGGKEIYFSDIFMNKAEEDVPGMLITAPVFGSDDAFIGVIAFEVDLNSVYTIIHDVSGLGTTGEVLVGKKAGNNVLYLNPLRHDRTVVLNKSVSMGGALGGPIQEAVQGRNGAGQLIDYRGKKVIAAWRYLPSLDWGMVAKIDVEEAFADEIKLRNLVTIILVVVLVLSGIIASSIARSISGPIKALSKGAEIVGSGNLDYKVATDLKDEIGQLSRTFDKMTRDLKMITASRDDLNEEIAERKRAEEEVAKLNEDLNHHVRQLEESNRELEAFSYSVSHDLRSPLRSIDGFSLALLEDYADKLDAEGRDYLVRVRGATQRMSQLIDDLLKLSRVARMELKRERVDLSATAAKIAAQLRESNPGVTKFVISEGLSATGDERLLTVVVENLFSNAWKFSEKMTAPVVEFGTVEIGGERAYFVRDNGAGFDMTYADKLFNPFQRLHKTSEFAGTGIGLATVKRIVNRHGGRVWIESEVGKGTMVYFTLG